MELDWYGKVLVVLYSQATEKNLIRMRAGKAPIGWDGYSVHLHHWEGIANNFGNYSPVSRSMHIIIHSTK
jgi:hypothetical protein